MRGTAGLCRERNGRWIGDQESASPVGQHTDVDAESDHDQTADKQHDQDQQRDDGEGYDCTNQARAAPRAASPAAHTGRVPHPWSDRDTQPKWQRRLLPTDRSRFAGVTTVIDVIRAGVTSVKSASDHTSADGFTVDAQTASHLRRNRGYPNCVRA